MNLYLLFILAVLAADYLLGLTVDLANLRRLRTSIPEEFEDWYDEYKYRRSQEYLRDTTRFELIRSSIATPAVILFILFGGFAWVDEAARSAGWGVIGTGLLFAGILTLLSQVLNLPFRLYSTFVLEERYGFNRTGWATYVMDLLKQWLLLAVLGAPVLAALIWFFSTFDQAWLIAWAGLTALQLVLIYVAPVVILPLFNRFTPLEAGELRDAISRYADEQDIPLRGIFTMDGSRRSTKSNAYFTGFGRWRRIVLFDTLVEKHSVPELVSIFAHEVGHAKLHHIRRMLAVSVLSTGLMLFILSLFITHEGLYAAFGVSMEPLPDGRLPVYAGLVFFGFLYAPINLLLGIAVNLLSRRHEFEADAFAVRTAGDPGAMIQALKKLTVDNLTNLSPHPWKVFLEYSHPPVLERIAAIRRQAEAATGPGEGAPVHSPRPPPQCT